MRLTASPAGPKPVCISDVSRVGWCALVSPRWTAYRVGHEKRDQQTVGQLSRLGGRTSGLQRHGRRREGAALARGYRSRGSGLLDSIEGMGQKEHDAVAG